MEAEHVPDGPEYDAAVEVDDDAMDAIVGVRHVDVIAPEDQPLEKVFGRELSDLILEAHAAKGVRLHLGSKVARIEDKQVLLQGGERADADIVVVGNGVEPRLQLAEAAGLALDRDVLVNSRLQSRDRNIFAAGALPAGPIPIQAKAFVWNIGSSPSARARSRPRIC
jgi:NADPH-dependent 2,4-dienoyl-CoA reductase/sulfur reductase-like enzyme